MCTSSWRCCRLHAALCPWLALPVLLPALALLAMLLRAAPLHGQSVRPTAGPDQQEVQITPVTFHTAPLLQLQPVGQPSVAAWYRLLQPGRANDQSPWRQLLWFKNDSRTAPKSYFASVDFAAGTLKVLPVMAPAMEPWDHAWVDGKLYIGTNLPPRLLLYDPAADTLRDLGKCFRGESLTLYRIAAAPDGVLALGGGTGSDVSLYDPRKGQFTHFGEVAAKPGGGTYAYYLSIDENYIYIAVRSSDPWELVRLDRKSKDRKVLLTAAAKHFMSLHHNVLEVSGKDESGQSFKNSYTLQQGELLPRDPAAAAPAPGWTVPGPGFSGKPPAVAIDTAPIAAGQDRLLVHIAAADGQSWRQAALDLRLDSHPLSLLTTLDDGRLVALPNARFAMLIVDPATGATTRVPATISAYGLLAVGPRIFIAGYPSARTLVFDTRQPITSPENLPQRPAVAEDSPAANPRLLNYFGQETGGAHIAMLLTRGADDHVYLIARRHRYFFGFALAWFNPEPDQEGRYSHGVYDDQGAFNHLQISSMQSIDHGEKLLITTQVQYDKQLPGEAPKSASIFLFDVRQRKMIGAWQPVPGATQMISATLVGPDTVVGACAGYVKPGVTTFFRFNIGSGALEQVRHHNWAPLGKRLIARADGKLWSAASYGNYAVLFTVEPTDLSLQALGRTEDRREMDLCFANGELYVSGFPQIMRVQGLALPGPPATQPAAGR